MTERNYKVLLAVALILSAASVFLSAVLFTQLATTTDRTNKALCTFRADVKQRLDNGSAFLAAHPHGIPGIPAGTLRQSLDAQRRTVKALHGLPCP